MLACEIKELLSSGYRLIEFSGILDDTSADVLSKLHVDASSVKKCVFDLRGVRHVNSFGIRVWSQFLRGFEEGRDIIFRHCSSNLIMQIVMMPQCLGSCKIESFYGSYLCVDCDHEEEVFFKVKSSKQETCRDVSSLKCKKCGRLLELETEESIFFSFLDEAG